MSKKDIVSPYVYPGLTIGPAIKSEIKKMARYNKLTLKKEEILEIISEECGVNVNDVMKKVRKSELVKVRHMYSAILRKYYGFSYPKIAEIMDKDHTTIIHSVDAFRNRYKNEEDYRELTNKIYDRIGIKTF
jgi:chromosomal replication initiation ATPase DnaA